MVWAICMLSVVAFTIYQNVSSNILENGLFFIVGTSVVTRMSPWGMAGFGRQICYPTCKMVNDGNTKLEVISSLFRDIGSNLSLKTQHSFRSN